MDNCRKQYLKINHIIDKNGLEMITNLLVMSWNSQTGHKKLLLIVGLKNIIPEPNKLHLKQDPNRVKPKKMPYFQFVSIKRSEWFF